MILYHYSENKIKRLKKKNYPQWAITVSNKPCGLWLSVLGEEGWEEWCKSEGFRVEELACRYKATIKSDANILKITNEQEIEALIEKYRTKDEILDIVMPWRKRTIQPFTARPQFLNWVEVAKDYQGIYVETYQSKYWMPYPCLYGWDCISACIWDINCIEEFKIDEK